METIINCGSLILFFSELLIFILKRSKSSEVKIRRDKLSAAIFLTIIPVSIFLNTYYSYLFPLFKHYLPFSGTGLLIIIAGVILRWTAIFQLKKAFTVDVAISYDHKIKKDGLYKSIRHPAYLGLLMEFLGFSFLFNSWLSLLLINIPLFLALLYRMKIEEELLVNNFGSDYENYMKNTNRLLPGIY